jgi:hypothetical protein
MPTAAIGNRGPATQTRAAHYASLRDEPRWASARVPAELLILRWMVSLDWAIVRPRLRRVPAGLIQTVSLERLVLAVTDAELA